ncbi:hypothetical protein CPB84DRAFT_1841447 [Gymnopilus junonius]|uniref:Homeobox domain-containing protein n=1 Tax=Gymnopilus junonius TaxID=109634 RepID=A0A9P5P1Y6_GYMJU|nr:hypothetical protein CPB84DRAFT_1841447 [Gymnopilus junonius]
MTSTPSQLGPLHFLASVISDIDNDNDKSLGKHSPSAYEFPNLGSSSPISDSLPTPFLQDMVNLHTPYRSTKAHQIVEQRVLRHSTSSKHISSPDTNFVPFIRHNSAKRTRKAVESNLSSRIQMKKRRKDLMDKATKIKSLDNSPVNERQLLVLRMVYDEITMYPCESWMVLIAIIINRAYKQVKNWFSNERQKDRSGESVPLETEDGDKVRLRASALETCQEWSDSFFEEVIMIYNYRIQRGSLRAII